MVDLKKLLKDHKVEFVEYGPNTGKGEISIACPLCGDDPSQHLGINLTNGYWHCWRNGKHSGRNLARVLALLNIFIIEEKTGVLQKLIDRTFFNPTMEEEVKEFPKVTGLPKTFIPLTNDSVLANPYLFYLKKRGFINPVSVAEEYGLQRPIGADKWVGRVIIPTHVKDEVSWTGRAIGTNALRYLSPSEGEARNIKQCIWNYNTLAQMTGETLVITEGPLDSLKIDWYNKPEVRATCLFGLSITDTQIKLLDEVCSNFNTVLVGLDQDTIPQSLMLMKALSRHNPIIIRPGTAKDFGEMDPEGMKKIFREALGDAEAIFTV